MRGFKTARSRGWVWLACGAALLVAAPVRAEPEDAPNGILRPCDARGEQGREAKALLWKIRGAAEAEEPTERVAAGILELLDHPCLALPRKELGEPVPADPRALVDWYRRGGRSWLDWATHTSPASRRLQLPPSFRPWLAGSALPATHPLKSIVCPDSEEACGPEVAGWLWRQERYPRRFWKGCESTENYRAFLGCVHQYLPRACLYPGGRFRRPDRGFFLWTRIGGGTLAWVFDLESRQALRYRTEPMVVREVPWTTSRSPTGEITTRTRRMAVPGRVLLEAGPVARDNLHEAVLALLLSHHCEPGLRGSLFEVPLPEVPRQFDPAAPLPETGFAGGFAGGTRYRRRAWSYLPDGQRVAVRLPLEAPEWSSEAPGRSIAPQSEELMTVVEGGFRPTRTVILSVERGNEVYEAITADRPRRLLALLQKLAAE